MCSSNAGRFGFSALTVRRPAEMLHRRPGHECSVCSPGMVWRVAERGTVMLKPLAFTFVFAALGLAGLARAEGANPTDPQIAMIAVVADNVDIDAGKLAKEKAQDPAVKELAESM